MDVAMALVFGAQTNVPGEMARKKETAGKTIKAHHRPSRRGSSNVCKLQLWKATQEAVQGKGDQASARMSWSLETREA